MSLLKRRDKYKHIGLALVPPAAFAAVPDSPPPNPKGKRHKTKVVASPIGPFALFAHKTAQAIALGGAHGVLDDIELSYDETDGNTSFLENDELYARVKRRASRNQRQDPEFIDEAAERCGTCKVLKTRQKNEAGASRTQRQKRKHIAFVDEAVSLEDVPLRSPERLPDSASSLTRRRGRSKPLTKKGAERAKLKLEAKLGAAEPSTSGMLSPREEIRADDEVTSPRGVLGVAERQDALEEEMRLRDEQNREMIINLMAGKRNASTPGMRTGGKQGEDRDEVLETFNVDDSDKLQEIANLLKEQSFAGAEGAALKYHMQEMIDENHVLKDTVRRLNVELSKYQEKYGDDPSALDDVSGIPADGPVPKWLVDPRYLSPLFASYDKEIELRNEMIAKYDAQGKKLSKQVEEIVAENETLRTITKDKRAEPYVAQEKWDNVKEQNTLMLEEIQVMVEQLELMEQKMREMHGRHVDEVARLSKRLAMADAEYQQAEKERKALKDNLRELQEKHDQLKIESSEKVPAQDHVRTVANFKNEIEDLKEKQLQELKGLMNKLKDVHKERSDALLQVTEEKALNKQLEGEVDALKSSRMKLNSEIEQLRESLEETERRETECQLHLANAIRVAEKASIERATLASLAEREQKSANLALERSMREKWEMGRMEETLKQCKIELASKNKDVNDRLREVEETHVGHMREQELEMLRLRKLLQQKQRDLDDMARSKKQIETELETVWQAAHNENRMMMEALHKSKRIF